MVVNGDGEHFFGVFLLDDILIQLCLDFFGFGDFSYPNAVIAQSDGIDVQST